MEWKQLLEHGTVVCGEPDFVEDRIREIRDVIGIDHLLCWTRLGGLAEEKVAARTELMRDEVMPALRQARRPVQGGAGRAPCGRGFRIVASSRLGEIREGPWT